MGLLQMQMQHRQLQVPSWSLKLTCPESKQCCQLVLFFVQGYPPNRLCLPLSLACSRVMPGRTCQSKSTSVLCCSCRACKSHRRRNSRKLFLQSLQIPPAQEQLTASLV